MIQLVDLKKQYKTIKKDVDAAIKGVIQRTDFIMGQDLDLFEKEFADFCQTKHCVGVDSGTGALELAFHALGQELARIAAIGLRMAKGGLSAENYIAISKATRTTATRDLTDLVEKGALVKTGELRYTRYRLNLSL